MRVRTLLMCAAVTSMAVACGRGQDATEADDADDAVTTSASTSQESALLSASAEELTAEPASMTDDQLAETASVKTKGRFKSGCVTATRNLNVVTYVLVDCTGPYGLVKVSGTIAVTYTRQVDGSVRAVAKGTGLKVNEGTLDLDAIAVYTKNPSTGVETAVVETHGKGTGPKGNTGDRTGNYTITRDVAAGCMSIDGTWSTEWNGNRVAKSSTEVTGLSKCKGACPAAGGKIVHTGVLGRVVTLTTDGTAVAAWSTSGGKSGTVNLECK